MNLRPDHRATLLEIGSRFWATIDKRKDLKDGRLVGCTPQRKDWPVWERHPDGDEILVLLSGELEMLFETRSGLRKIGLRAGRTLVVPRNTWHRALVRKPGKLMFITPGAGTEHRRVTL